MILTSRHKIYIDILLVCFIISACLKVAWISDDAFITLRVVKNFIEGFGIRYNIDERVQVFTHPLWFLLLTVIGFSRSPLVSTSILLGVTATAASTFLLLRQTATSIHSCAIAILFIASTALIDFSSSGLETPLTVLLTIGFVRHVYEQRLEAAGWCSSLLLLNRLDNLFIVLPFILYLCWNRRWRILLYSTLLPTMWCFFSILYFGTPLPNTFYAKSLHGFDIADRLERGWFYLLHSITKDPMSCFLIVFGSLAGLFLRTASLAAIGAVLHVAYITSIGGDFMAGRFLVPAMSVGLTISALSIGKSKSIWTPLVTILVSAIVMWYAVPSALRPKQTQPRSSAWFAHSIIDERAYYASIGGLWTEGRRTFHPRIVRRIKNQHRQYKTEFRDKAGRVAFLLGPQYHVIDYFGLTDMFVARLPYARKNWRPGHLRRVVPIAYGRMVQHKVIPTTQSHLSEIVYDLWKISRGPIWNFDRFEAIWSLHFGSLGQALKRYSGDYSNKLVLNGADTHIVSELPWGGLEITLGEYSTNYSTICLTPKRNSKLKVALHGPRCERTVTLTSKDSEKFCRLFVFNCSLSSLQTLRIIPQDAFSHDQITIDLK